MEALTQATQLYISGFGQYTPQFTQWGKSLFFGLLILNVIFMAIRYAFDDQAIHQSMSHFLKQFFVAGFFYTLMMNPSWLSSLLVSTKTMGTQLTNVSVDPSSLVSQGISLANKIAAPMRNSSLLSIGFSLIVLFVVYAIVLFVFLSLALEVAITLITTTALISLSTFLLAFAGHSKTQSIAQHVLDLILSQCIKLLGIYCVVGVGSQTLQLVANSIPTSPEALNQGGFDPYVWVVATALLLWLLAKNFPNQLARLVSTLGHDLQGTSAAAMGMSALQTARVALPAIRSVFTRTQHSFNQGRLGSIDSTLSSLLSPSGAHPTSPSSLTTGLSERFTQLSQLNESKPVSPPKAGT